MEKVLLECDGFATFPSYAACVKARYTKVGNQKKAGPVWAFYALLDRFKKCMSNLRILPTR